MTRIVLVVFIVACLLIFPSCQVTIVPILDVPSQSIEDGKVNIYVAIDAPGWLVLHPTTEAGEPDTSEELSRTYLAVAGEWTDEDTDIDVTVPLLVGEERTIFARLYYDDPLDRKFEPSTDNSSDPPVMSNTDIIQDSFIVPGVSPYIEIEEGNTSRKFVFQVGIDAPGWFMLHPEADEGGPDTSTLLVGAVFPKAGHQKAFNVTIPDTVEEGATLYAALYYDDPLDEEFTYTPDSDEDLPVQVDSSDLIESFEVTD